jgi:hypothetical protein
MPMDYLLYRVPNGILGGLMVRSVGGNFALDSIRHALKADDRFVSLLNGLNASSIISLGRTYSGPYVG